MDAPSLSGAGQVERSEAKALRRSSTLHRLWFPAAILAVGLYAGLPWMAPAFMRLGWTAPAEAIYDIYSTQCHQLAQRSYFLFGSKLMYAPPELGVADPAADFAVLRAFRGDPATGWKVAWSDRMVAMYTSLLVFLVAARLLGRRVRPLPVWAFLLLLLPMAIDGATHFVSDLSGFGQGFRDTNLWLAGLTGGGFAPTFYAGDAWGSFNATMRLLTGILFGLGVVWFAAPRIEESLQSADNAEAARRRREAARSELRTKLKPVYNSSRPGGPQPGGQSDLHAAGPRPVDGGE
jgi:uncharacterized membrane protein